jgi:hypothetical protein
MLLRRNLVSTAALDLGPDARTAGRADPGVPASETRFQMLEIPPGTPIDDPTLTPLRAPREAGVCYVALTDLDKIASVIPFTNIARCCNLQTGCSKFRPRNVPLLPSVHAVEASGRFGLACDNGRWRWKGSVTRKPGAFSVFDPGHLRLTGGQ